MSMFTVTGEVRNVFYQPGATDKQTGEVKPGSDKVQILGTLPVQGGGEKEDIITLTIPEGLTSLRIDRIVEHVVLPR